MATSGAPEEASLSSLSGMASWVPLNLSDRWALGLVLTILGRYRVNRMANGMDGIVGKGREGRRRRKYLVCVGGEVPHALSVDVLCMYIQSF
jgi:hypothetical protein